MSNAVFDTAVMRFLPLGSTLLALGCTFGWFFGMLRLDCTLFLWVVQLLSVATCAVPSVHVQAPGGWRECDFV